MIMVAKITIICRVTGETAEEQLLEIKRDIESGQFQRDTSNGGFNVKATFEYIER